MSNATSPIRLARPSDAPDIASLYRELVNSPEISVLPEQIATISIDPKVALFVYELEGSLVATALVSLCPDAMFGHQPFAVIENVVVSAQIRGKGIGSLLLQRIEAFCLQNDCSKIMLLSSIQREEAHRFFERAGFVGSSKRGFIKYRREFKLTSVTA